MFQTIRIALPSWLERIRAGFGRRAAAIFLTLLFEGLLAFLLFTLAPSIVRREEVEMSVFSLEAEPDPAQSEQAPAPSEPEARSEPPLPEPEQALPQPVEPQPAPVPLIVLSPEQMATADIGALRPPTPPRRQVAGPPNPGTSGDTPRVDGQGPNGEPLYAASWYREPYDEELSGYLSTARGPGWGLIACRTVANYRVEDCVAVAEYPEGVNITRAVLAAAWQFRVRPPQIGGRPRIGEWVRIRIDYNLRQQ